MPQANASADPPPLRLLLRLQGRLQGVGARPALARQALARGLSGWVRNAPQGVELALQGPAEAVEAFVAALPVLLPAAARLDALAREALPPVAEAGFVILASQAEGTAAPALLPDAATCPDCLRELQDPADRRYRYPFISCSSCGPRYSIALALPFDRANTHMAAFPPCPACQAEYRDPHDRRFHAQTLCCPACGPRLWWVDADGRPLPGEPIAEAASALRDGQIVALKGVGGYQLLVDACNEAAVARLRQRKQRPHKPLALLVQDVRQAAALVALDAAASAWLADPSAPILLLPRRPSAIAPSVAPATPYLGLMLPASPLHHLLLAAFGGPLVCTSGNLAGAPLCIDDAEARQSLAPIADRLLGHDRPIAQRLDDAVLQLLQGRPQWLRRARGRVPEALRVSPRLPDWLALGGQHKHSHAIGLAGQLLLSAPHGELDQPEALQAARGDISHHQRLYQWSPAAVLHDLHPDYASTAEAATFALPRQGVPHHLAHIAAVVGEHGLQPPLLGVAWDGLGLGADGQLCGGECYAIGEGGPRLSHRLRPIPLPGGDRAAREPRRALLGALYELQGVEALAHPLLTDRFEPGELAVLGQMLHKGLNCPRASSVGRLFDAVASLLGLRQHNRFEGDAAMQLQFAAEGWRGEVTPYPLPLAHGQLDWRPLLAALLAEPAPVALQARRFHLTLAEALAQLAQQGGFVQVAVGGGCFQNRLLLQLCQQALVARGIALYCPEQIPAHDGGLAAGQLMAAALGWVALP